MTGVSGAGKSSLAFDTIYAEAQRRFVESMSTYSRQFLDQMERPADHRHERHLAGRRVGRPQRDQERPVHRWHHHRNARCSAVCCSPIWAKCAVRTVTERCRRTNQIRCAKRWASEAVTVEGKRPKVLLLADVPRPPKRANDALRELVRQGFFRRLEGNEIVRMTPSSRWLVRLDPLPVVLGRFSVPDGSGAGSTRLTEAIEQAYALGRGRARVLFQDTDREAQHVGRGLTCARCGAQPARPQPGLFSFNSPLGACTTCQGFGRVVGIDATRVIPNPEKSLEQRPIAPWNSPAYEGLYAPLFEACQARGVSLEIPWAKLPKADRDWIWKGKKGFTSIERWFARLERRSYRMHLRVLLARYRAYEPCKACDGRRLRPDALAVRLADSTLPELTAKSVEELRGWLEEQNWSPGQTARAGHLLEQLAGRLDTPSTRWSRLPDFGPSGTYSLGR